MQAEVLKFRKKLVKRLLDDPKTKVNEADTAHSTVDTEEVEEVPPPNQ
jgi:hypothetical protein